MVYCNEPLEYLAQTLHALAEQTCKPNKIIIAITELSNTADDSVNSNPIAELCANALRESGISYTALTVRNAKNFGQSVSGALTEFQTHADSAAAAAVLHSSGTPLNSAEKTWIWLLHTDSAPLSDALEFMLKTGEDSQMIGAIGPKQVFWDPHDDGSYDLLEVGINATRSARRVPEVISGERDQGQLDRREDILAVGSAGMLIRYTVFTEINGFNPNLGPFGDGLEISRRIWSSGYRVVGCPAARIRHAQLSLRRELTHAAGHTAIPAGIRVTPSSEISEKSLAKSYGERRTAQIFNSLLAQPGVLLPLAWIGYIFGGIPRAIVRLAWRDLTRAGGEIKASFETLQNLRSIIKGRNQIAGTRVNQKSLRNLESSASDIRRAKHSLREANIEAKKMALLPDPLTLKAQQDLARHQRRGMFYAFLSALIIMCTLFIPYFAAGALTGGQLTADNAVGTDLWNIIRNSWMISGDGIPNTVDPLWILYLPILLIGQPFGINLGLAVTFTLYLTPVLGTLSAYLAAGRFTRSWMIRYFMSLLWILAPAYIESLHTGRIGPALVHALLPLFAWAFIGALRKRPGGIGIAALILAVLSASAPVFLLLGIVLSLFTLIFNHRFSWIWLPVPAIVLLLPQLITLSQDTFSTYFLANPGIPTANYAAGIDILRGYTTLAFNLQHWTIIGFAALAALYVIALFALLRTGIIARYVRLGWLIIILGITAAVGTLYVPVPGIDSLGQPILSSPWHGTFVSISWLGLFIVLTAGAHGLRTALRARSFGCAQIIGGGFMLLLPFSLIGLFAVSAGIQFNPSGQVLSAANTQVLPAIAETYINSPNRSRVLALHAVNSRKPAGAGEYQAELWRGSGIALHEYTMAANTIRRIGNRNDSASQDLAQSVANLLAASPDAAAQLQAHGIAVVLLPPPADFALTRSANSAGKRITGMESERKTASANAIDVLGANSAAAFADQIFPSTAARDNLAAILRAVPGLEYVTENETGMFWRVVPETGLKISARAWINTDTANSGENPGELRAIASQPYKIETRVETLPRTGTIELAERAGNNWHAALNGTELTKTRSANGWAQAWDLSSISGERAGTLTIWYENPIHGWIISAQLLIGVISLVAALPLRNRKKSE
ncbi:glycosyltransferase [Arcanobacterium hippocoleae]